MPNDIDHARALSAPDRLVALRRLALLDTPSEESFDRLTRVASTVLHAPIALVSLVDEDRQFFKSCVGLPEALASSRETPLSHSFCQHTVITGEPLIVGDSRLDPRVWHNQAIPDINVIAYAGMPLLTSDGQVLGSFCVIDHQPRLWTDEELNILRDLAASVITEIELRLAMLEAERQRLLAESERQQRIESLEFERERLAEVLRQMPAGVLIADAPTGEIVLGNTYVTAMLHRSVDPADAQQPYTNWKAYHADGRPFTHLDWPLARALQLGETVSHQEIEYERDDGSRGYMSMSAAPIRDRSGQVSAAVATLEDITEMKQVERDRLRLLEEKGDFLSAVAHDLKTPLTSIKGFAQLISRQLGRDTPIERARLADQVRSIDSTATRMASLVNELLDVTRIQAEQPFDLQRRPVDLVALVQGAIAEQSAQNGDRHINLQCSQPVMILSVDPERLDRAITNLLSNAIKYSSDREPVEVALHEHESKVSIRVADRGIGIPAADLPTIFERFRRGSNVVGVVAGTGIGLVGAKQIVEQHGGSIEVQSREGEGTVFTVHLPVDTEE